MGKRNQSSPILRRTGITDTGLRGDFSFVKQILLSAYLVLDTELPWVLGIHLGTKLVKLLSPEA